MKLRTKMFFCIVVVCAIFSMALATALFGMNETAKKFDSFIERDQAFLSAGTSLYAQGLQMGQAMRNIVLEPANGQAYKNLEAASREFEGALQAAQRLAANDPRASEALARIGSLRGELARVQQKVVELTRSDDAAARAMLTKQETPLWRKLRGEIMELVKEKNAQVAAAKDELAKTTREKLLVCLVLAALALAAAGVIAFLLTRSVMRQLGGEPDYAVKIAAGIAAGDLTARIVLDERNRDSLLYAITTMQESLSVLVAKVRAGTETIATASSQIAAGNQDLSARTEEQASSLEETASSMEELTSTVRQNADNARQANQLAQSAADVAAEGGAVVQQVVETMGAINESSKKIVDIISAIDGIAFQTNILALNAAVEAARAGEQGRGFAVVAAEVRTLAQRSAAAAKEIKELIGDSVGNVDAGSKLVDRAGETMTHIVASIRRVNDIMGEITAASAEQSAGIEQVNQAVGQMDQVTQQNAALVEEAAAAAESMQNQAAQLNIVVSAFKLEQSAAQPAGYGGAATRAVSRTAKSTAAVAQPKPAAPAQQRIPARLQKAQSRGEGADWEEF